MKHDPNTETWQRLVLTLKQVAAEKGISHYMIADLTGLAQSNVNRFFAVRNKPRLDTFIKIAEAIDVHVSLTILEK